MNKDKSQESQVLSNKVTQDIELAMKPVLDLSYATPEDKDYDHAHSTLASGICALRDADKITCARVADVKGTVDRIDNRLAESNGHVAVLQWGFLKGLPVKYLFYAACLALCLCSGIVMFAITHGKLSDLAEAVNIARGTARLEVEAVAENKVAHKE